MIEFITSRWEDILAIYGGLVAICTTLVKITPSTKDDSVVDRVIKILDLFSTAFTKSDAKKLGKK